MTKYRNHKHPRAVLRSPQYSQHVMAMTAEKLHDKGDIAEELAARDIAIAGLLRYHQEGEDGAELPREYWSTGYREAVEFAESIMGSNDRVEGRDAALSRRVPSHDGLCGNGSEVGDGGTAKKGQK